MFDSELLYGLVRMPWWGYALVVYGGIQIMFLGITLFLHREQSHGSLELHPDPASFLPFLSVVLLGHRHQGMGGRAPSSPRVLRTRWATRTARWSSA